MEEIHIAHEKLYSDNLKNFYNFNFSHTPKTFFINNPKIASRYLTEVCKQNTTRFWVDFPSTDINYYPNETNSNQSYVDEIYRDWDNIRNGANKKDIIILYRDPLKRLVSAIIQDSLGVIGNTSNQLLLYSTFKLLGFSESDVDLLIEWRETAHPSDFDFSKRYSMTNDNTIIPSMMKHVYRIYIENLLKRSDWQSSHASPHNLPLVYLLNSVKFDMNKVKFIDLDESPDKLGEYLKSIEIKVPENKHSNNILGPQMVYDILLNECGYELRNILHGELIGYNILKSFERNLNK